MELIHVYKIMVVSLLVFKITACNEADVQNSNNDTLTSDAENYYDTETDTDHNADSASENTGDGKIQEARSELSYCLEPEISDSDYRNYITSTNDFGLSVFKALAKGTSLQKNLVYSPVSVSLALGMAYAGAKGDTASQMSSAMNNTLTDELFHAAGNRTMLELDSRNIDPHPPKDGGEDGGEGELSVKLSPVNAIWAQENYTVETEFLDTLSVNYDSGIKLVDFIFSFEQARLAINEWAYRQTYERIEELLPPDSLNSNTRVVLTNALYFKGSWATPFLTEMTSEGFFNYFSKEAVLVPMMRQTISTSYLARDGYQLASIPYDGEELFMTIILPDEGRFEEIRDKIDASQLEADLKAAESNLVSFVLPRFSFSFGSVSMKEILESRGMTDAFDELKADFRGISTEENLYIADVLHQAFIGIDEYGTEAAAATAVIFETVSIPPPPVNFTVDRPFVFLIHDINDLVLFVGQVTDPAV